MEGQREYQRPTRLVRMDAEPSFQNSPQEVISDERVPKVASLAMAFMRYSGIEKVKESSFGKWIKDRFFANNHKQEAQPEERRRKTMRGLKRLAYTSAIIGAVVLPAHTTHAEARNVSCTDVYASHDFYFGGWEIYHNEVIDEGTAHVNFQYCTDGTNVWKGAWGVDCNADGVIPGLFQTTNTWVGVDAQGGNGTPLEVGCNFDTNLLVKGNWEISHNYMRVAIIPADGNMEVIRGN